MPRSIATPSPVIEALERGAALAISVSGGKDSEAMLVALVAARAAHNWPGPCLAIHADLGRAEWAQTPGHVRFMTDRQGVPLTVVRRPQGDLVDEIHDRVRKLGGSAPAWPSAKARYCTSDQKRGPIDKVLRSSPWPSASQRYCTADQKRDQLLKRQRTLGGLVVTAMGLRAEESSARAKRSTVSVGKRLTSKRLRDMAPAEALAAWRPGERLVLEWLPIHDWLEADDVWPTLGYSQVEVNRRRALARAGHQDEALDGWTAHPAYVMGLGNKRLSCSLCILGCRSDLENGARFNPALFREYLQIELETGYTFKRDLALADLDVAHELAPDLVGPRARARQLPLEADDSVRPAATCAA